MRITVKFGALGASGGSMEFGDTVQLFHSKQDIDMDPKMKVCPLYVM